MHKLVVLYPPPNDPDKFREYYESTHLPLARKLPGVRSMRHGYHVAGVGADSPYFAMFEAEFDSVADMGAAMSSSEGQAVAADVPNYATGGAVIAHYDVAPPAVDVRAILLRYLDFWSKGDVEGIVSMFAPGGVYTDPSLAGREIGGDELRQFLSTMFGLVPDMRLEVSGAGSAGPRTGLATWRMTGTAAPTGRSFDLSGGDRLELDDEGRIVWTEALYDQKTFAEQGGF